MWAVLAFELKKRFKLVSTYVFFGVLFGIGFLWMNVSGGAFASASASFGSKVYANAPWTLTVSMSFIGLVCISVIASIFARAMANDFEVDIHALIFATPIKTRDYFFARFIGAVLVYAVVALGVPLGALLGSVMPYLEPSLIGPNNLAGYFVPYAQLLVVNGMVFGAIFFAIAALTRKPFAAQVTSILILIGYLVSGRALKKLDQKTIADLLDPTASAAVDHLSEYWTVVEKNTLLVPLSGNFLLNRLLWLAVATACLVFAYARFMRTFALMEKTKIAKVSERMAVPARPALTPRYDRYWRQLPALTWLQLKASVRNRSFLVIALAGVLMMIQSGRQLDQMWDTATYPVTYLVLSVVGGTFFVFMLAITTYFGGDLIWRERDAKMDQIVDATPVPTWLLFAQKLLALMGVQVLMTCLVMLTAIALQASQGYFQFELGLYVRQLFLIDLPGYFCIAILCLLVQALVNDKYAGHFIVVAYYVFAQFKGQMGLEHSLYDFPASPTATYSAMNGFGHYARIITVYNVYWMLAAIALAGICGAFFVRGTDQTFSRRAKNLKRLRLAIAVPAALCALVGGYIYYNTNVLNDFRPSLAQDLDAVRYEKDYQKYFDLPQPSILAVDLRADIYPEQRRLHAQGTLQVKNTGTQPVDRFLMNVGQDATVHAIVGAEIDRRDEALNLLVMKMALAPGATGVITYDIDYQPKGFRNNDENTALVENGTFFEGDIPSFGFRRAARIQNEGKRKKYGLPVTENMMPKPDDAGARDVPVLGTGADWITLHTVVSTSADQTAFASGRLLKTWQEGDRRFFEYAVEGKMANLFAFQSGRYETRKDKWGDVDLEINYHPTHTYNLDKMFGGMKAALDYMTTQFGPYQHSLLRIVEFPRYQRFAQSLPNTVPFSEAIGFIARVDPDSPTDIDYPFFVTAHEVAHQWWGHQLLPAYAQGATMISESLAEYSALMVMKHKLGEPQMRRFLKQELERYLRGRSGERNRERPLEYAENQAYIHYAKGALAFYALADMVGEDVLNKAIAGYLRKVAFQGPPYPVSSEFLKDVRAALPQEYAYLIEDLFQTITLYDNRATEAKASKREDGKYDVTVKVLAKKMRADGLGEEHDVDMNDFIDVGWEDAKGAVHVSKQRLKGGEQTLSLVADEKPVKAGIDPLNKLIDRKSEDNAVGVSL